jgi:GT2 family glycosyltransferase
MDVTVIIPQHGATELTARCVASLLRHEGAGSEILMVDDGTPGGRIARCGGAERTRVVHGRWRGVTAAWNVGVRLAASEIVLLVNNDVMWEGPALERLVAPLQTGVTELVGVAWRAEPHWPQTLAERCPPRPLLAGWCWGFRRSVWERAGGFDESLRLYFSDTDFQLRVLERAMNPLEVVEVPLRHVGHATTRWLPERRAIWEGDRRRFLEKWS